MLKPKKAWTITKGGKWWGLSIFKTKKRAKSSLEVNQSIGVKHLAIVAVELRERKGK